MKKSDQIRIEIEQTQRVFEKKSARISELENEIIEIPEILKALENDLNNAIEAEDAELAAELEAEKNTETI